MIETVEAQQEPLRPQLQNWVTVESSFGLRNFNLFLGDVTTCQDPAIAVPTHANTSIKPAGVVLEKMQETYGIDFESREPLLVPEHGFGTYEIAKCGSLTNRKVLLVRIPGILSAEARGEDPVGLYRHALWTLFGSLAALELRNERLTSLAMPLMAATRGFEIKGTMRTILKAALDWLRVSRFMKSVNLYLIDPQMVETWTTAMDEVLERRFVDSAQNQVVHALRDEILARLAALEGRYKASSWASCSDNLRTSLSHKQIVLERVAAESRALIECIITALLKEDGVQQPKGRLDDHIKELRRRNKIAPWILSHFDSLRIFGNAGVHLAGDVAYHPPRLRDDDLTAILAALQRVLAFAQESDAPRTKE